MDNMREPTEKDIREAAERLKPYGVQIVRREPVAKQEEHKEDYH
jgi:hypothetical protein